MLAEEEEVSLVVESDHPSAAVVGVRVEEAGQQSSHAVPQGRVEVVENYLRFVAGHPVCPLPHTAASHTTSVLQDIM